MVPQRSIPMQRQPLKFRLPTYFPNSVERCMDMNSSPSSMDFHPAKDTTLLGSFIHINFYYWKCFLCSDASVPPELICTALFPSWKLYWGCGSVGYLFWSKVVWKCVYDLEQRGHLNVVTGKMTLRSLFAHIIIHFRVSLRFWSGILFFHH